MQPRGVFESWFRRRRCCDAAEAQAVRLQQADRQAGRQTNTQHARRQMFTFESPFESDRTARVVLRALELATPNEAAVASAAVRARFLSPSTSNSVLGLKMQME